MKVLIKIFVSVLLLGTASSASAQCGPTNVDPTPQITGLCEGASETIDFLTSGTCNGNYEYQVLTSTNIIVQPWSTNSQYVSTPTTTDTYTVNVRCSACPATVVSDTFLIEVISAPIIVADSFVCYGTPANYSASGPPAGTMSWWDSPTGGTQLSTTSNYTSPPMTAEDTIYMQVNGTITGGSNQGSILITECGLDGFPGSSSADYLEISNLYATPVNTTGWVVAVSDSYSNLNSRNSILWNLPASFTACTMLSKTDVSGQPNYWGNNIFWNPYSPGWVAIVDNVGNLVDFIAWGWTAAQLTNFNVNINGFQITLGTEWTGNGCNSNCGVVGGVPYSFSRTGNSDNNNAGDFICQATSLNTVNPGLNCGWISSNISCPYPAIVKVDLPPTASAPDTTVVYCYADIPAPDPLIIIDETDDHTAIPSVQFIGEVSNGNLCPEILTRTYRVADSCSSFIDVNHIIIINDTVAPTMDTAPADINISCISELPPIASLNWADNCLGSGTVLGVEVSSGTTCPEILTRTWTISDTCGNTTTRTQVITVSDIIPPVIDAAPADLSVQCPSDIPVMASLNWTDNCDGNGVLNGVEVSDGQSCPETITRTWTRTDACGNTSTETQVITLNDDTPPTASGLPSLQLPVLPPADTDLITDAADNCGTPLVEWVGDNSDGGSCPENVIRTYSLTDDCGNVTYINQNFIIGDYLPNVSFTADPTFLDNLSDGVVEFDNNTTGAVSYTWNFGDNSPLSNEVNPSHQFDISATRNYNVWLVATSEYDCSDSTYLPISVFQELIYFVTNAFTPDNNNINQTFQTVFAAGFDVNDYNFKVFNRWGQILFESFNHEVGWDGTYNGKIVQDGTYIYKIEFGLEHNDGRQVISGHFTLLR